MALAVTYTFTNTTIADANQVNQNFTDILNILSDGTKALAFSSLTLGSTANLGGSVTLGSSTANLVTVNGSLATSLPLQTNTTIDIGSSTLGLRALYLGGTSTFTGKLIAPTLSGSAIYTLPTVTGTILADTTVRAPTVQTFSTPGAYTYTKPTNPSPLYLRVRIVGAGGGGGGTPALGATAAGTGGDTTFDVLLTAKGGILGDVNFGGLGGSGTVASGTAGFVIVGGHGGSGIGSNSTLINGGIGGSSALGPGGFGGNTSVQSGTVGIRGGGGGGGVGGSSINGGGGGGAAGMIEAIITSPASSYIGTVAAGGTAGLGTNANGSKGGDGFVFVEEFYQ